MNNSIINNFLSRECLESINVLTDNDEHYKRAEEEFYNVLFANVSCPQKVQEIEEVANTWMTRAMALSYLRGMQDLYAFSLALQNIGE